MASQQPSFPIVACSAGPPSQIQRSNAKQLVKENPTNRTVQWEELPKAVTVICPAENTMLWAELPKVTTDVTRKTSEEEMKLMKEMVSTAPSPPSTTMVTSLSSTMLDTYDEMKTKTKARMPDLLPSCSTVSSIFEFPATAKQMNECLLDSESTWDEEVITTEDALHSKGHEDLVEQLMDTSSCPSAQYIPYCAKFEIEYKQSSFLETYPSVTSIAGMPSKSIKREENWLAEQKSIWKKQSKTKDVLQPYASKDDEKNRMNMVLLVPSCPRDAGNPGFPSIRQNSFGFFELNMVDVYPGCPNVSNTSGPPSISDAVNKLEVSQSEPILEKKMKTEHVMMKSLKEEDEINLMGAAGPTSPTHSCVSGIPSIPQPTTAHNGSEIKSVLLLEDNKMDKDIKGVVPLVQSNPVESFISGFPSETKPRIIHFVDMMVSLSNICPKGSQIPGFLSSHNSGDWTISREPLFEPRVKIKQVSVIDRCEKDKREMKSMVSLVPSCPTKARASGFPSQPYPQTVYGTPKMISLLPLCSQVSKIHGFPSVDVHMSEEWPIEKGSLLKRIKKKKVILDTSNDNKEKMKNMVSCVPSCPKNSNIPGFPSIPNPQMVYFGLNMINLLPLCPLVSIIPGFSSIEGLEEGWIAELGSLMHRPLKNIQFRINSSPSNVDKPNTMLALVPSCPGASKIPGFPSVPRYNMLSLVPICPSVTSLPGFASFEGATKFQWIFDLHVLCEKPSKETIFVINSPNQDKETLKTMMALVPCCPEASRIPGFPSAPQTKPKIEPDMISFLSCCSSASSLKGFASMTNIQSTGWPNKTKPIIIKPLGKSLQVILPWVGQNQLYGFNMKSMVTIVTCCPKKARACGFPSAQVVNKPPDMVSLYTSAPCVSCVPGFPSARMLSTECKNIHTRTTHKWSLFEKVKNKRTYIKTHEHTLTQDEMKYMVAMAPSCPHLSQFPGLPSISQLNLTENETMTIPFPCTEKHTSQEWPCDQSAQSYLKDVRIPGGPATSLSSSSTAPAYGEILTMSRLRSQSCLYGCFLLCILLCMCFYDRRHMQSWCKAKHRTLCS